VVDAALSAAAAAKNDRDCFIAPRATRWSTGLSPLIIMITRWAMGWVRREAGKGMKKIWIHPLVRSQPVLSTYLGLPSALVLLCTPMRYVAYASTIEATKSNFSLLSTLLRHTPVSKEK